MSELPPREGRVVNESSETSYAEAFYAKALGRMARFMLIGTLVLSVIAAVWFGWRAALGFAVGCAIAYFNFSRLKRMVSALADRTTQTATKQSSAGVVLRFLLRYLLMAAVAYVIIKRWPESLNGLLAGLFLPVLAVMVEGAQELVFSLRREN